ncbi:MAG: undecaprenyldiphospho-muramoylpentapeptide beta-N-acetylglucosaminyltransferase [Ruminococcaceae bacterium]|nr:undecaprenyldiphospho-muramoylpentapeptide beta-N-acetylglucosaminyltransferase [Oscillospiraceae bacterium]
MRVLFCGGGTAGHVTPAIAIAQTIMRNSNENKVAYVVTRNGIENRLVDFKKYVIDVIGFKRKFSFDNFKFIYKQIKAIEDCKRIITEFHPDIVFGTGGYATYPVVIAAKKMGIKTVLHESNAIPGKAVLSLQKKVDKILINFEDSKKYFKHSDKIILTGNPIRNNFEAYEKAEIKRQLGIRQRYVILCTGGSMGANRINSSAVELIDNIVKLQKEIFFIWSTGKKEYESSIQMLKSRGLFGLNNVMLSDYFANMPQLMASADVVISRAGAMTISELAYTKKASILVPSPNVTNNHQYINASTLEKSGAAIMITEDKLYLLVDIVKDLIYNESKRKLLEENIGEYAMKDANKKIFSILYNML